MDLVWLTYDELAERLGIERESARQQVKRKRWARRPGNDGKVRIGVPEDVLSANTNPGTEGGKDPVDDRAQPRAHDLGPAAVLSRHIERLEVEIEALKQERTNALARAADRDAVAAQVAGLQVVMQVKKQRIIELQFDRDGLRADRDRWVAHAERLAAQAERLAAATRLRSWLPWRRSA